MAHGLDRCVERREKAATPPSKCRSAQCLTHLRASMILVRMRADSTSIQPSPPPGV